VDGRSDELRASWGSIAKRCAGIWAWQNQGSGQGKTCPCGDHERETDQGTITAQESPNHLVVPRGIFSKNQSFPPNRKSRTQVRSRPGASPLSCILQRKLAIGRVDDPLKREADRVANQVMRMQVNNLRAEALMQWARREDAMPKLWARNRR
jgi:hypothetical protein